MKRTHVFLVALMIICVSTFAFANDIAVNEMAVIPTISTAPDIDVGAFDVIFDINAVAPIILERFAFSKTMKAEIIVLLLGNTEANLPIPADIGYVDLIFMQPAAQDVFDIRLNQLIVEVNTGKIPTSVANSGIYFRLNQLIVEVTTGKIPTSVANSGIYFRNENTFDDNFAPNLVRVTTEIYRTVMLDDFNYRMGTVSEDLVGKMNLANVRTLGVDGKAAGRNPIIDGMTNTMTPDIAQKTSGMKIDDTTSDFTCETVDGTANARKDVSDGNAITPVNGGTIAVTTKSLGHGAIDNKTILLKMTNLVNNTNTATTSGKISVMTEYANQAVETLQIDTTSAGGICMTALINEDGFATTPGAGVYSITATG